MKIREYRPEDLHFILHEMNGEASRRRQDKFKLVESSDAFRCYVAEEESSIQGFVIFEELGDGISYYVAQINVAERRRGIGRKLIEMMFDAVGKEGHISLCINTDNTTSIKFFEAMGFTRSGHVEGYRKDQDKYWYQIDL